MTPESMSTAMPTATHTRRTCSECGRAKPRWSFPRLFVLFESGVDSASAFSRWLLALDVAGVPDVEDGSAA